MIEHIVSLARPHTRSVQVELRAPVDPASASVHVRFPVWTPGSYLVREHERHVHDFRAFGADGRALPAVKTEKALWVVQTGGTPHVRLTWEVYAHELTVRTSHVDASHAFLNPVTLCAYLPGREKESQRLVVRDLPAGWGVACALPTDRRSADAAAGAGAGSGPGQQTGPGAPPAGPSGADADAPGRPDARAGAVFVADDFEHLVDSPLECGPHVRDARRFTVRGVTHELVVWGRARPADLDRLATETARIVETQARFWGGLPYERYVILLLLADQGRGGLEHRCSTALLMPRSCFLKPRGWEDLLGLVSHELFHAWNVKRLKPAVFAPPDLSRENHTRLLWAFEGWTSYYGDLLLERAGLVERGRYLEKLGEALTQLERTPGRLRMPVAEASFEAWTRLYRQDENTDNSTVSYYLKGQLVALLLDLELRRRTRGGRSLDDVLRLLWWRHGRAGVGVPEDGVEKACAEVLGEPLDELFARVVHGTDELPLDEPLASHALRLVRRAATGADDKGGTAGSGATLRCHIGLVLKNDNERVRVAAVRRGSPAEEAGVAPGDELVAVDGLRAETGNAFARLHDREPGSTAALTVFRRDELLQLSVRAGAPATDTVMLAVDADAPPEAAALLDAWLSPLNPEA